MKTTARKQRQDIAPQQLNEPRESQVLDCDHCDRRRVRVKIAAYPEGGGLFDLLPCVCRDKKVGAK